jgi:siroheme synthase-like protein
VTRPAFPVVLTGAALDRCVVVGGGPIAERKVSALLESGATVVVISPALTEGLRRSSEAGRFEHIARPYREGDLRGGTLAFAATSDRAVNAAVAAEARRSGILVDVVDDADGGTFATPATVRRGDLLVTVSTGGRSPALAAHVRREIEGRIGPEYGALLALCARLRRSVAEDVPVAARARLWQQLASGHMAGLFRAGAGARAEEEAARLIAAARSHGNTREEGRYE